jgi:uncharacterized membrane protein
MFVNVLTFLYLVTGFVVLVGYIPTVESLWGRKDSANRATYMVWFFTSSISLVYDSLMIGDIYLIFKDAVNVFFCLLIVILIYRNKYT